MTPEERKALWLRLRRYQFDDIVPPQLKDRVLHLFGGADASVYAFANKLCRKLGWKMPFALTAIAEYKKFVYLGVTSPFPVTPPKVIDQVWHEHVLFTHGYQSFCDQVLGRRFDHFPELIPTADQTDVFQAQYAGTLELYEREFGVPPPDALWSVAKFTQTKARARAKGETRDTTTSTGGGDTPLCQMFGDSSSSGGSALGSFAGFAGGESGGAGASATWDDAGSGAGDAGDSGGGSSGCSGGSSCSSGCGGGGGD